MAKATSNGKAKWPKTVPVFTPRMIHKGGFRDCDGPRKQCFCAMGWIGQVFGGGYWKGGLVDPPRPVAKARRTFEAIIGIVNSDVSIPEWNDAPRTSKRRIADALNETCRRLGYTEIIDA